MKSLKLVMPSSIRPRHRGEGVVVDAADDLVEAVVDRAVAGRLRVPGGQAVLDALAVALHGEVDDRRRAAPGRGAGAGLERVDRGGAAERQLHVGVRVDAAGDHVLAGRVDDGVDGCRDIRPEQLRAGLQHGDDRLAVDEHVGVRCGRSPRRRCRP